MNETVPHAYKKSLGFESESEASKKFLKFTCSYFIHMKAFCLVPKVPKLLQTMINLLNGDKNISYNKLILLKSHFTTCLDHLKIKVEGDANL